MLVNDEVRVERNLKVESAHAQAAQTGAWVMEQLDRHIDDVEGTASNPQRQLGRMLPSPDRLEQVLQSFCPNLIVEQFDATRRLMDFVKPDGTRIRACVYGSGPMPEWSIKNCKYKWVPDPDYVLGKRKLERSELRGEPLSLTAAEDLIKEKGLRGATDELLQRRNDAGLDEKDYRPGFIRVLEDSSEAVRGWRTVIAYVLGKELITVTQAQQAVTLLGGTEDRASWAYRTGAREGAQ